ncbi:MAG TPA: DUF3018 family protein [Solidesulfovibrio magneticus]|nr:DUF3018 family protein [Solidesulfovibrio magneticus]
MRHACSLHVPAKSGWRVRLVAAGRFRASRRTAGLRRITLLVPDASLAAVRREARRESLLLASQEDELRTMDFLESLAEPEDWEA